jgi:hypothetical protein
MSTFNFRTPVLTALLLAAAPAFALNAPQGDTPITLAQTALPASAAKPAVPQLSQLPARDGSFYVSLPTGWLSLPIPPNAYQSVRFNATNPSTDGNVMIETFNAADITDWVTWTNANILRLTSTMGSPTTTPLQHIKVNGLDAVQGEVSGILNGGKWHYMVTAFKTDKYYYIVKAWTFESEFDAQRDEFSQLPNGIHF